VRNFNFLILEIWDLSFLTILIFIIIIIINLKKCPTTIECQFTQMQSFKKLNILNINKITLFLEKIEKDCNKIIKNNYNKQ